MHLEVGEAVRGVDASFLSRAHDGAFERLVEREGSRVGPDQAVGIDNDGCWVEILEDPHASLCHGDLGSAVAEVDAELRPQCLDDRVPDVHSERTVSVFRHREERLAFE